VADKANNACFTAKPCNRTEAIVIGKNKIPEKAAMPIASKLGGLYLSASRLLRHTRRKDAALNSRAKSTKIFVIF
jgi:hypothetical protein